MLLETEFKLESMLMCSQNEIVIVEIKLQTTQFVFVHRVDLLDVNCGCCGHLTFRAWTWMSVSVDKKVLGRADN